MNLRHEAITTLISLGFRRRNPPVGVVRAFAHRKRNQTVRGNQAAENLQFFRLITLAGGSPCACRAKPESGVARERHPSNHGHGSSFLQSADCRSCENSTRRVYSVDRLNHLLSKESPDLRFRVLEDSHRKGGDSRERKNRVTIRYN